jgi:hypothetical protein
MSEPGSTVDTQWVGDMVSVAGRDQTDHWNPVQVRRAYKFRAYLTRPQEGRPGALLRDHCDLYDAGADLD